jgi:hypothetical protein
MACVLLHSLIIISFQSQESKAFFENAFRSHMHYFRLFDFLFFQAYHPGSNPIPKGDEKAQFFK